MQCQFCILHPSSLIPYPSSLIPQPSAPHPASLHPTYLFLHPLSRIPYPMSTFVTFKLVGNLLKTQWRTMSKTELDHNILMYQGTQWHSVIQNSIQFLCTFEIPYHAFHSSSCTTGETVMDVSNTDNKFAT